MTSGYQPMPQVQCSDRHSDRAGGQTLPGVGASRCQNAPTAGNEPSQIAPPNKVQALVDEIRAARAHAAELCILLGDLDGARAAANEMGAQVLARRAARLEWAEARGECFFDAAGRIDGGMPR